MKQREKFGSRLGFILVSAGCAVGLGNVWKFPYICGQYGGAVFILVYLLFLLMLGLPILISEFSVGRGSGKGISNAFDELQPEGQKWHRFKWAGMAGNYLLMMFYSMVGGWMLYYAYKSATGQLAGLNVEQISGVFTEMKGSVPTLLLWTVIAVLLSFGICSLGMKNGVEKITKVMMCLLIVLMVVLAVHSLILKGAGEGVRFYLVPDFSKVKENGIGEMIFAAMSHAFFTLSVGMGSMEIFGSYLEKKNTIVSEAINVVLVDTFVAITAGLIIIPACFAFGIEPDAGPSLLFLTLPTVFSNMVGGRIWGTCFFIFMSFAALSTIVAVFENILSFYMDGLHWERGKAVKLNIVLIIALSIPAILGYNVLSGIQPIGAGSNIMDLEDFLVSYNLLPLGSLIFVFFCTRKNGWGWDNFLKEANTGKGLKLKQGLRFYMSYILPLIVIVVYLYGYYGTFEKQGTTALIGWMAFAVLLLLSTLGIALGLSKKKSKNEQELVIDE